MALFDLFRSKKFEKLFETALADEMSKSENKGEVVGEIADNYLILLGLLRIGSFASFHFPDREDPRTVEVDGKVYDFDGAFRHGNRKATEALCTIDALIADSDESVETLLTRVEETMNHKKI